MQRSAFLAPLLLAGSLALAGCGESATAPVASAENRPPSGMCAGPDSPLNYYCGEIDQPLDPGDVGGGGGGEPTGGGDSGGGGDAAGPFAPPVQPYFQAPNLPTYTGGAYPNVYYSCGQVTHPFFGFSNDVVRGTTIYVSGIVVPGTKMNWGIYNQAGQQVLTHLTQSAGNNCVVAHEPEGISTAGLAPGYYYLYASYMQLQQYYGVESSAGYSLTNSGKYVGALRVR